MKFKRIYCLYFLLCAALQGFTQTTVFPTPPSTPLHLFYLQRSSNTNTIVVDIHRKGAVPDEDEPVHVYWLRYQENGQKEELNFIQRKFAYGIKAKKIASNQFELNFVSYKKQKFFLMPGADKQYHVYAVINGKTVLLSRVYLHINGGSFWKPNVEYMELAGTDPVTHQAVKERKKI